MAAAKSSVPIPTLPPRAQPAARAVTSSPVRTSHSGCPLAARPVMSPSWGPGSEAGADVEAGPQRGDDDAAHQHGPALGKAGRGRDHPEEGVDDEPDGHRVDDRAEPEALPDRDPQHEEGQAEQDDDGAEAQAGELGEALVQHVVGATPRRAWSMRVIPPERTTMPTRRRGSRRRSSARLGSVTTWSAALLRGEPRRGALVEVQRGVRRGARGSTPDRRW